MQFYDNSKIRPAKSGEYYAITEGGSHMILGYSSVHQAWNVRDDKDLYDPETEIRSLAGRSNRRRIRRC